MLNTLLLGILVVAGVGLVFLALRRKPAATSQTRAVAATAREGLLQIVIPASGACCAAARRVETHRFHKHTAPALPLADCSMKPGCHCRYQPVPERRVADRRRGDDKRDTIRFEENPRRQGKGRRAEDKLFDHD